MAALAEPDTSTPRPELQLLLAHSLLRDGKLEDARKQASSLLDTERTKKDALLLLARVELAENKPESALDRLKPLLEAPAFEGAREVAALALIASKNQNAATVQLEQLLAENPGHMMAVKLLVNLQLESGTPQDALNTIAGLVARAPQDPRLRVLQVEVMHTLGRDDAAAQALQQGVSALPNQARLWLELSRYYLAQKETEKAISVLEEAHAKNPGDHMLAAALASDLALAGRQKEAAPLFEQILKAAKDDVVALNNLAMFQTDDLNDPKKGVELAERAHKLAPKEAAITDTLGWALFRLGTEEAIKKAEELLLEAQPALKSPTSKYHLGAVLLRAGKKSEGESLLRQAIASPLNFPELEEARQLLEGSK
jgi:tetratricopeptide (TPR) repeat protein